MGSDPSLPGDDDGMGTVDRWNHNVHYDRLVLDAVPPGCHRALDVGCGDGRLARDLATRIPEVTAIDADGPTLTAARASGGGVRYVEGDVLTHPLTPASFDLVVSVASLHHLEMEAGLARFRDLLRPGGTLVVVGLARARLWSPTDAVQALGGVVASRTLRARRGYWEPDVPTVWPPPETYRSARRVAQRVLPGVRFRRHLLFRYSLTWTHPG